MKCKVFNNNVYEWCCLEEIVIATELAQFTINTVDVIEWKMSKKGKWCREHAKDIKYSSYNNLAMMQTHITICGYLKSSDKTWFLLTFG